MKKITVKTGFGYLTDISGHTVSKVELPAGEYDLNIPDDCTYTEVRDQAELKMIKIYSDPADVQDGIYNDKIKKKIRQTAIDQLIADGELPADYKD